MPKLTEGERKMIDRPSIVKDEHLTYLDELRESGVTNMFGARPYLQGEFTELSRSESAAVLTYWMESFGERKEKTNG